VSKILIVSDSHQDNETLNNILKRYAGNLVIHAGDSCLKKDDQLLKDAIVVKGNHDDEDYAEYYVYPPFFICHGHTFSVYHTFDKMIEKAKENHCSIIIHGHTHIPYDSIYEGIRIINPGSTMINRGSCGYGTYAVIDTNTLQLNFHHHVTHEIVNDIVINDGIKTLNEFRDLIKQFSL